MRIGPGDLQQIVPDPMVLAQRQAQNSAINELKKEVEGNLQQEETKEKRINTEELNKLIEEIKRKFDMLNKYLRIDIDTDLEIPVAKIIERDTNRVIRQIPPEYLLELMKRIDQMLGILLDREV